MTFLLGVYVIMCVPWGGTRTLPQGCSIFFRTVRLVFASSSFLDQWLSEPDPWNSGKAMEAEWGQFPKNKKLGTQNGFCAQEHHKVLLGYNFSSDLQTGM